MVWVYVFLIGSCLASFVNVVIWRVPRKLSFISGRSFCPSCKKTLQWFELVPIVSYWLLRGKCRRCGAKISVRDAGIEWSGGILALWCLHTYAQPLDALLLFAICMMLLAIACIDLDFMIIPNGLLLALLFPISILVLLHPELALTNRFIGFFIVSLPMYLCIRMRPGSFGGGDVKFIALFGFLLGWQKTILASILAVWLAGAYALYIVACKQGCKETRMAFGPYLSFGVLVALVYGEQILHVYRSLLI